MGCPEAKRRGFGGGHVLTRPGGHIPPAAAGNGDDQASARLRRPQGRDVFQKPGPSAAGAAVISVGTRRQHRAHGRLRRRAPSCRRKWCLRRSAARHREKDSSSKDLEMLALFELHGVPVINGAKCSTLGTNKWLHHQVLQRAGAGGSGAHKVRFSSFPSL